MLRTFLQVSCLLTLFFPNVLLAQISKVDRAKEHLQSKEISAAKELIDVAITHPKTKDLAEAWYVRGLTYSAMDMDPKLKVAGLKDTALYSFRRAYELNAKDYQKFVLTYNAGVNPVLYVYDAYRNDAAGFYNQKKYKEAAESFQKALGVNAYLSTIPQSERPILDTATLVNIGLCYELAGDKTSSAVYYEQIADAKIAGDTYSNIYRWLCFYYYKTSPDSLKLNKYLFIAKKLYPQDDFYSKLELERVRNKAGQNKEELFDSYEASLAQTPQDMDLLKSYAADLFNYLHPSGGKKPENAVARKERLEELYTQILALEKDKKQDVELDFGKHYYNEYLSQSEDVKPLNIKLNSLGEQIYNIDKSKKKDSKTLEQKKALESEVKKVKNQKEEIKVQSMQTLDLAIKYLESAYRYYDAQFQKGGMKAYEKNILKTNIDLLIVCFEEKKDKAKEAFYNQKYSEVK